MSGLPEIPGFTLLGPLGKGGMGEVYLARDESLGRRVALKLISGATSGLDGEIARERFLHEARVMASLAHPNLAGIHSLGDDGGRIYIVMELLEGGSLADRLRQRGRLSVREALEVTGQICDGLAAAWEHRILHRDIKPSNVLFGENGAAKVADFGLARPLREVGDMKRTRTGFVLGSPHYMSPERASQQEIDIRSDLYSVGIVLYEMLTGSPPFEGESDLVIIARHLSGPVPDVAAGQPEIPRDVAALVRRLTRREPAERPASPDAVRAEVDRLLALLDAPAGRPRRARRWAAAGLTALMMGAALAGWAWIQAGHPPTSRPHRPPPAGSPRHRVPPQKPPVFALGPEAAPAEVGRTLAALRTGRFGLELAPVAGSPPRWRVFARRSVYPILLALEEDGDLHRLVPAGLGAGDQLPGGTPFVLPGSSQTAPPRKVWMFLVATEKPLVQPVILGALPESDSTTLYPRRRIGTADQVYPAQAYLRWLTGSLGGSAGAWDAVALDPDQGG